MFHGIKQSVCLTSLSGSKSSNPVWFDIKVGETRETNVRAFYSLTFSFVLLCWPWYAQNLTVCCLKWDISSFTCLWSNSAYARFPGFPCALLPGTCHFSSSHSVSVICSVCVYVASTACQNQKSADFKLRIHIYVLYYSWPSWVLGIFFFPTGTQNYLEACCWINSVSVIT